MLCIAIAVVAASRDLFGRSVAIWGNTAIVGAQHNDDAGDSSGSAYLFTPEPASVLLALLGLLSLRITRHRNRDEPLAPGGILRLWPILWYETIRQPDYTTGQ